MLLPMGLPEGVSVIAWGLSLERYIDTHISNSIVAYKMSELLDSFSFIFSHLQTHHDQIRNQQHPRARGPQSEPTDGVRQPDMPTGLINDHHKAQHMDSFELIHLLI